MAYYTNDITLSLFDETGKPSRDLAEYAYNEVVAELQAKEYDVTNRAVRKHPSKRLIDNMSVENAEIHIDGNELGFFYPGGETIGADFLKEIIRMIPGVRMALAVSTWETYSGSTIHIRYDPASKAMTEIYHLWNNDGYDCETTTVYRFEDKQLIKISQETEDRSRVEREDCDGLSFVFYDGFEEDFEQQYQYCKFFVFKEIFEDKKGGIIEEEITEETDYYVYNDSNDLEEKDRDKYEDQKRMIEKAEKNGVEVISSKEFFERFLDIEYELEHY